MTDVNPSASDSANGPGEQLLTARTEKSLTREEVGDALNLSAQTVEWLETNNYEKLPTSAFTQGYLRNYAKHLGLDPTEVIAAYQNTAGLPSEDWTAAVRPTRTGIADYLHRHPGVFLTGAVVAVGILIGALLIVVWPEDESTSALNAGADEAVTDSSLATPGNDKESTLRSAPTNASARGAQPRSDNAPTGRFVEPVLPSVSSNSAPSRDAAQVPPPVDPNDPLAHIPIAQTYPVEGGTVELVSDDDPASTISRRLTPQGDDLISVRFDENCWLEVKATNGEQLFALLGRPGQALELVGSGPFQLVLGYAPGVELRYNSELVNIAPYIRNDVASFVVGQ